MSSYEFSSNEYLQRINLDTEISPTLECLEKLHSAQHRSIPFENFDIALGRSIDLAPEAVFNKLVGKKRGGYCFELNSLMLQALKYFGFDARALLGRVHIKGKVTGRGHQISLVSFSEGQLIVDVGFGSNSPFTPIPLIFNKEITACNQSFKLLKHDLYGIMLKIKLKGKWTDLYSFDLDHVCDGDIAYGNYYTSTNPASIFVSARVAALPVDGGIITLLNNTLRKQINGEVIVMTLKKDQTYLEELKRNFGIELDASYEDFR